ncbi:hypothetical protein I6N90_02020 [Paenibacillus sp. GSMTC-2017]|nr:hypothetical protein [Paenibacillus sp. GSMTC-2017]
MLNIVLWQNKNNVNHIVVNVRCRSDGYFPFKNNCRTQSLVYIIHEEKAGIQVIQEKPLKLIMNRLPKKIKPMLCASAYSDMFVIIMI